MAETDPVFLPTWELVESTTIFSSFFLIFRLFRPFLLHLAPDRLARLGLVDPLEPAALVPRDEPPFVAGVERDPPDPCEVVDGDLAEVDGRVDLGRGNGQMRGTSEEGVLNARPCGVSGWRSCGGAGESSQGDASSNSDP